jgi:hypothetical protein
MGHIFKVYIVHSISVIQGKWHWQQKQNTHLGLLAWWIHLCPLENTSICLFLHGLGRNILHKEVVLIRSPPPSSYCWVTRSYPNTSTHSLSGTSRKRPQGHLRSSLLDPPWVPTISYAWKQTILRAKRYRPYVFLPWTFLSTLMLRFVCTTAAGAYHDVLMYNPSGSLGCYQSHQARYHCRFCTSQMP